MHNLVRTSSSMMKKMKIIAQTTNIISNNAPTLNSTQVDQEQVSQVAPSVERPLDLVLTGRVMLV